MVKSWLGIFQHLNAETLTLIHKLYISQLIIIWLLYTFCSQATAEQCNGLFFSYIILIGRYNGVYQVHKSVLENILVCSLVLRLAYRLCGYYTNVYSVVSLIGSNLSFIVYTIHYDYIQTDHFSTYRGTAIYNSNAKRGFWMQICM